MKGKVDHHSLMADDDNRNVPIEKSIVCIWRNDMKCIVKVGVGGKMN
jgi:hypothetical protein